MRSLWHDRLFQVVLALFALSGAGLVGTIAVGLAHVPWKELTPWIIGGVASTAFFLIWLVVMIVASRSQTKPEPSITAPAIGQVTGGVVSQHQSGGVTVGAVNVSATPTSDLIVQPIFAARSEDGEFHSQFHMRVESAYQRANLVVQAAAPSILRTVLTPSPGRPVVMKSSASGDGFRQESLQQPYGNLTLDVFTTSPDAIELTWEFQ